MKDTDTLAEIRAWRDEFARAHGYDLAAIAAAVREADKAAGARLVRGEPRRPASWFAGPAVEEEVAPAAAGR